MASSRRQINTLRLIWKLSKRITKLEEHLKEAEKAVGRALMEDEIERHRRIAGQR